MALVVLLIALFVLIPLLLVVVRSVLNGEGRFIGLANFARCFSTPSLRQSMVNTLAVGLITSAATVLLAFPFAYTVARTPVRVRRLFLVVGMLPLYAPTMLFGLGLIFLFGNQGLVTHGFFGRIPFSLDIGLYGRTGIVLAEIIATFPAAVLVLVVSLSNADRRLYEAASSLGASAYRTFWAVTIPACRLGLLSAASISFVLTVTDFGAPQVLGKRVTVLATDLYGQVVGLQDFGTGAAISLVLLIPTAIACGVELLLRRKQSAALTARSVPLTPHRRPVIDRAMTVYCALICSAIVIVVATPLVVSLVRNWPYSFSDPGRVRGSVFTLDHFDFASIADATGGGYQACFNTLLVAAVTAVAGTIAVFVTAYLVEKTGLASAVRATVRVLAVVPLGLPGLVLGLSFAVAFSPPRWGPVPNPVAGIYGTLWILVICNVVHFFGVGFLTASAAVKKLDDEFEHVAASLAVPAWRLLARVTIPICVPALLEIAVFNFVSTTTTISAVIFLQSTETPLASVSVVTLDDAGLTQSAAAMASLIVLGNVALRTAVSPFMRFCTTRASRWAIAAGS